MNDLSYLEDGLVLDSRMRDGLAERARALATTWLAAGVDAAAIELLAEHVARWADLLGETTVTADELVGVAGALPDDVTRLLRVAMPKPASRVELAAVAVHLLDIAEAMALQTFIPELPALHARSDRSGDAARNVGLARHLKG